MLTFAEIFNANWFWFGPLMLAVALVGVLITVTDLFGSFEAMDKGAKKLKRRFGLESSDRGVDYVEK